MKLIGKLGRIGDLQRRATTLLLHAQRRWPDAINTHLWPYAIRCANETRNTCPTKTSALYFVNAGFLRIAVLTQYKSHSLDRHITTTWRMSTLLGNYITPVPAQQRLGPRWCIHYAHYQIMDLTVYLTLLYYQNAIGVVTLVELTLDFT